MIVNNLTIEKMSEEHIAYVAAWEHKHFATPWKEAELTRSLQDNNTDFYVLTSGVTPVGYIGIVYGVDTADIVTLFICPECRRSGYASQILSLSFEKMQQRGIEKVFLEVRESNTPARNLYEKHGFEYLNKRVRYYANPVEDAWVMIKEMIK